MDLVCGPASPLPETHQRYRLVAHLGSGGQAEVYRAVRVTGAVSSAPLSVKVFRVDPRRRLDGFYGPPPHRPGEHPSTGDAVPYQVYDYLHGLNLREYVSRRGEWAG